MKQQNILCKSTSLCYETTRDTVPPQTSGKLVTVIEICTCPFLCNAYLSSPLDVLFHVHILPIWSYSSVTSWKQPNPLKASVCTAWIGLTWVFQFIEESRWCYFPSFCITNKKIVQKSNKVTEIWKFENRRGHSSYITCSHFKLRNLKMWSACNWALCTWASSNIPVNSNIGSALKRSFRLGHSIPQPFPAHQSHNF